MISGLLLQFASIFAALLKGLVSLKLLSGQGKEFYGTVSQFAVITALFGSILSLQLDNATVRYAVGANARPLGGIILANVLLILAIGTLLFLACIPGGGLVSTFVYDQPDMKLPVLLSVLSSILTAMQLVMLSGLQATTRFKAMTLVQIGQSIMQVLAIALALRYHRPVAVMAALVAVDALTLAGGWYLLRAQLGLARPDWAYLRHAIPFVAPLCGAFLLTWVIHSGGRFLLVHHQGLAAVGVYSATFSIANLASMLAPPFVKVVYPVVSATVDHTAQGKLMRVWLRRYAICANFMFIILTGLGHLLLKSVSSAEFFAGRWVMAGLAFGFICTGFTRMLSILLQTHDKTNTMMSTLAVGAVCGLVIAALGVDHWGANALALGYAVGFGLPLLLMWPAIPKAGLLPSQASTLKLGAAGLLTNGVTVLPLLVFHAENLWQGVPVGLLCTALFMVTAVKTRLIAPADVAKLSQWVRQRLRARARHA